MQVHAIYENGRLTFQQPIRLKSKRIEVDIIIPDNCIDIELQSEQKNDEELNRSHGTDTSPSGNNHDSISARFSPTRERLDAILGPWRGKLGSVTPQDVKEIWHQHLEEKYLGSK